MATQTVAADTVTAILAEASGLTDTYGSFTVGQVATVTGRSETTARAAVTQLIADGAVVKDGARGWYRVVTTKTVDEDGEHVDLIDELYAFATNEDGVRVLPDPAVTSLDDLGVELAGCDEVDDPEGPAGQPDPEVAESLNDDKPTGYHVYAYGAHDEVLTLRRVGTWVLTSDAELENFKQSTELPVSGWAGGKRRAVKELRVYISGSPLDSPAVATLRPQELKRAREAATA